MAVSSKPWYEPWIPPWWKEELPEEKKESYARKQQAFIEENGYYITLPEFEDIIHVRKPPEVTEDQYREWSRARRKGETPNIHPAIADYLDHKQRQKESIMASPQPEWMKYIGSVMTWLDDTEDAITTGVMLGRFALKLIPRFGARFVPYLGWVLLGADVLSLGSCIWGWGTGQAGRGRMGKRKLYDVASRNPFSRGAKVARAKRLARKLPGAGEIIESLQTLDNLAGVGVSFGPIMGALTDTLAGAVRSVRGEKVTPRFPSISRDPLNQRIWRTLTTTGDIWGGSPYWDDETLQTSLLAFGIGMNTLAATGADIGTAYDEIDDWGDYEVEGRRPWNPATIWMLEEDGIDIESSIGWPTTGTRWISYGERAKRVREDFPYKFKEWSYRNRYSLEAYMTSQMITQATEMWIQGAEGVENVTYQDSDYTALVMNTFHNNFYPAPETSTISMMAWAEECRKYKKETGKLPPTKWQKEAMERRGIKYSDSLPERNVGIAAEIWPEFA